MTRTPLIVGLGGTTRPGSTSERLLRKALDHAQSMGCRTMAFGGAELQFEIYDPARSERSEAAAALVQALREADGVLIATPAYHGGVSGLVKNAIDFVEDLREDDRVYLQGRAVGCLVCADGSQAIGSTLAALRAIVHALRGWPTPFGAAFEKPNLPPDGDPRAAQAAETRSCELVASEVVDFARMRLASR